MSDSANRAALIDLVADLRETEALSIVQTRLDSGDDPIEILDDVQSAMQIVCERYDAGDYFVSSLMLAAEIFREATEIVSPALAQRTTEPPLGRALVATVRDFVHDITQNIVATLLGHYGFELTELSVDAGPDAIVAAVVDSRPDIIVITGLLTVPHELLRETLEKVRAHPDAAISQTPTIVIGGRFNDAEYALVGADEWCTEGLRGVQICREIVTRGRSESSAALEDI